MRLQYDIYQHIRLCGVGVRDSNWGGKISRQCWLQGVGVRKGLKFGGKISR